ncbi:arginine--tRNA ligase [Planctomycetota bacterium]
MRDLKLRLETALTEILLGLKERGAIGKVKDEQIKRVATFEIPSDPTRGDLASTCALQLGKKREVSPKQLAGVLCERLHASLGDTIREAKAEGPGFVNVFFEKKIYLDLLLQVHKRGADCGRGEFGAKQKVQIEFVSANPTGPLSVAHGRQAAVGDCVARLLEYTGHDVTREYFLNDCGNQIDLLGKSIHARLLELHGKESEFPEEGYQGDYIRDIAAELDKDEQKKRLEEEQGKASAALAGHGVKNILSGIKKDLRKFRVKFDEWTSQAKLERSGAVEETVSKLKEAGRTYEKEGALWLKGTELGDFQDRVLIKADGSYTYRTPDIAYHAQKFARGFERVIDLWGPDHHGHIPSLTSGVAALGLPTERLDLRIVQQCTLWKGKEKMKMSTRAGTFVTLREVMEQAGVDAARYFFLMRKMDSQLDFDLELASQRSLDNPVYYVQYAHARIAGISDHALKDPRFTEKDFEHSLYCGKAEGLDSLTEEDLKLIPPMARFPLEVASAARSLDPQRITKYAHDLSAVFQRFYTLGKKDPAYRVVTDDTDLTKARLYLLAAFSHVLKASLSLLGVSAPSSM